LSGSRPSGAELGSGSRTGSGGTAGGGGSLGRDGSGEESGDNEEPHFEFGLRVFETKTKKVNSSFES